MRVLDRVRATPIVTEVRVPGVDRTVAMEIGEAEVLRGVFDALYDVNTTRAVPFVIDQLARGNDEVVAPLAQRNVDLADYYTEGLSWSLHCAEELPFYPPQPAASDPLAARYAAARPVVPWCSSWPVPALGEVEDQPVRSDIPTLLMSGGHDPVTPPSQARRAAETLTRHYLFEFASMGHGTVWQNWMDPCPAEIAGRFLSDPTREPDAACAAAMTMAPFLTAREIHPTQAIVRVSVDMLQRRDPVPIALVVGCGVAFVVGLVGGVVTLVRRVVGRGGRRVEAVAALAASVVQLGYAAAVFLVLRSTEQLVLGFGIPAAARLPLVAAGALAGVAAVWVALVAWSAWARGVGSVAVRVVVTVVAAASMLFTGWMLARGMLFW